LKKYRKVKRAKHVLSMGEKRNEYEILAGKPEGIQQ
jgi:hypothetical protein